MAVHNVEATVEGCLLSSHLGATVWVGGPNSSALILGCTITGGAQNGVWVCEEGRARVVATRIAGNRWPTMAGGAHAVLEITDSELVDNLDGGVAAVDGALLVIEGSTVAGNAGTGILLGAAAPSSRVEDCSVERNSDEGILVAAARGCAVLRNRVHGNGIGIGVLGGASPRVEGNDLAGNGTGIGVRGRGTDPVVIGNTVAGTRLTGIVVDEAAAGRFEGNTVSGAGGARHLGGRRGLGARLLGQPGLGQRRRRGVRDGRRRRPLPVERPARQRRGLLEAGPAGRPRAHREPRGHGTSAA